MLARTDLFAECLTQAIGARFQDREVVRLRTPTAFWTATS